VDAEHSPAEWQLRLVAGAVGAATSGVAAVVTGLTGIGLVMGVVGIPVGALLGLCYAPEFMADGDSSAVDDVVGLATLIGTVAVAMVLALSQAEGASPAEVLQFGFLATAGLGIVSLIFGLPLTRIVMRAAISVGRQLAPRATLLWIPSAVLLAAVAAGTVQVVILALRVHGDGVIQAAHLGQP
jgi:hypothetical protein